MNLRIPGPTPCPEPVLQAQTKAMIDHRGNEFAQTLNDITARLKEFFLTRGDMFILTASGTGAMEASVVNTLSPGDEVLSLCHGSFSNRFAAIAQTYGAQVRRLEFPWGSPVDPDAVRSALREHRGIKAVLITHNETSTGVTNDLKTLAALGREFDKVVLVDAISSIGSLPLHADDWGCDVVATASQKGWMAPPGLAMVSFSARAWQAHAQAKMPRFYWDFAKAKTFAERGQTPWTPAVSTFFALKAALDLMAKEGLKNVWARHERVGQHTRSGIKRLGLSLFAQESHASNTVTAIQTPQGVDAKRLLQIIGKEKGVELSGGQEKLAGQIFRIGHLGLVNEADIDDVLAALKYGLPKAATQPTPAPR